MCDIKSVCWVCIMTISCDMWLFTWIFNWGVMNMLANKTLKKRWWNKRRSLTGATAQVLHYRLNSCCFTSHCVIMSMQPLYSMNYKPDGGLKLFKAENYRNCRISNPNMTLWPEAQHSQTKQLVTFLPELYSITSSLIPCLTHIPSSPAHYTEFHTFPSPTPHYPQPSL